MHHNTVTLPVLAGLLASLLVACGAAGGAGGDGDPIVVGTTDTIEATADAPAPFDPVQSYDVGTWNLLRGTYQTLLRLPRTGTEPVPEAARGCGFRDTQNEQYRCTLRDGLKFTNGERLTAQDVKFSIDRMLAISYANGPISLMNGVDRVEAASDHEVVFHLKKPDATFPQKLATPAAAIVDGATYPKNGLHTGFELVGSGPYQLTAQHKGDRVTKVVFTRNPEYKGGVKARNETVEMRFFADSDAMENALREGSIDLMNRTLTPRQIEGLEDARDSGVVLQEMPGQEIRYLAFNTEAPVVGEKAVRQAMAQLVDRPALVRDVYERTGDPLYSLVPTGLTGHINSFFSEYGNPDPDAARRILERAGVPTPVELTLTYTKNHYGSITADEFKALRGQLNKGGVFDADIKGVDSWQQFREKSAKGAYQVWGMGWYPDIPDADNYIAPFIGKGNFLSSPYRNHRIEHQLVPATRQQTDRNAAAESFKEAQDIVAEDVPILPLWQGKQYVAARDDITGVEWALNGSSALQIWELGRGVEN